MATKNVTFSGTCKWAKVRENQIDREYEDERRGGNWSIIVELDEPSLKLFNALQTRSKLKDNNALTLRRYEFANFGKGVEKLTPPKVTGVDEDQLIGNGSTVDALCEVYTFEYKGKPGVGVRLLGVDVRELVVYERPAGVEAPAGEAVPF